MPAPPALGSSSSGMGVGVEVAVGVGTGVGVMVSGMSYEPATGIDGVGVRVGNGVACGVGVWVGGVVACGVGVLVAAGPGGGDTDPD